MRRDREHQFLRDQAFTLVELLVCVGVVAVLAAFLSAATGKGLEYAKSTREVSAARQLMAAYLRYPAENDGKLLPGVINESAKDKDGTTIPGIIAKRWFFRLGSYFDFEYAGIAVVNDSLADCMKEKTESARRYMASVQPSLGLNATFVGGNFDSNHPTLGGFGKELRADTDAATYGEFAVTRLVQAVKPSQLIVFASAWRKNGASVAMGNFYLLAPRTTGGMRWSREFQESSDSTNFGEVHPRWNGKAVVANLDGSVALLDQESLKDMRRWANPAAEADDPDWSLQPLN